MKTICIRTAATNQRDLRTANKSKQLLTKMVRNKESLLMTINELADFDDVATALIVDPYLSCQTHKMRRFPPNTKIWDKLKRLIIENRHDKELAFEALKDYIPKLPSYNNSIELNKCFIKNRSNSGDSSQSVESNESFFLKEKSDLKHRFRAYTTSNYTPRELRLLKIHICRFIEFLNPALSGLNLVICNRYSGDKKHPAGGKIISERYFKKGELLTYLTGVVASDRTGKNGQRVSQITGKKRKLHDDDSYYESNRSVIIPDVNDFSVTVSCRTKEHQLWLGPAAYINHDCRPNCKLRATGTTSSSTAIYEVIADVKPGEELCIHYGNNFFGDNNCQCECMTCELRSRGFFAAQRKVQQALQISRIKDKMALTRSKTRKITGKKSKIKRENKNKNKNASDSEPESFIRSTRAQKLNNVNGRLSRCSINSQLSGSSNSENIFHQGPNFSVIVGKYSLRHNDSRLDRKNW